MITAIVRFKVDVGLTATQANSLFYATMRKYQGLDGLIRKYYLFDSISSTAGGVYLCASREAADAVFTPEWRQAIVTQFGTEPRIAYFDTPIVIDNETEDVLIVTE